jgi:adenine-specific DNA methylase
MDKKPIEIDFPIEQVNKIAEREAHAKEKYRPVLYIHKWWARRLGCVFRTIVLYTLLDEKAKVLEDDGRWRSVTKEELENPWLLYLKDVDLGGKIVLDPMMGGGTTVVDALRLGCKVVAQDINPVAWFLVKKIVEPVGIDELKEAFKKLEREVADEIKKYYKTICPHCLKKYAELRGRKPEEVIREAAEKLKNVKDPREVYKQYSFKENVGFPGNEKNIFADTMYYFWTKEIPCLGCGTKIPLFRGYMLAHKRDKTGYYVICPECGNIFDVKDHRKNVNCLKCGGEFNPDTDGNVKGNKYVCTNPSCGQKNVIIEAIQRTGKPKERLYAVEYYCPHCGRKDYKHVDEIDFSLFEKAKEEYEEVERRWLGKYIPNTEIPMGYNTKQMINYGYRYWKDMFNERQLLSLGKLLKTILELNLDENVKELLILSFSNFTDYNNMLIPYNPAKNHILHLFRTHAFHPTHFPTENNVWGVKFGTGTFVKFFNSLLKGKEYNLNPFEKYVEYGKTLEKSSKVKIVGKLGNFLNCEDTTSKDSNLIIACGDSSYLDISNDPVDAVITDPPYYGNVMYSELSEFYYVWLRLVLKDKYECFQSEHVPNATEVIVNDAQGKDENDFIEGLTGIFKEAGRKLKKDGLIVFTFHHQEEKAWGAVLQAVLNADFYISSIYSVQSESTTSMHIINKANVRYDMIVVCRKRETTPEKKHWAQIEDKIYFKVEDELKRLEKRERNLSPEDVFVVTIGKCLELYSKHYPEVYKGEKRVDIQEALSSIREIVDTQLMHTRFTQIAYETDIPTAICLFYLAGKTSISYDSLNKNLKMRSLSTREVIDSGLVEKEGSQLLVLTPMERKSIIESKRKENFSLIDRVHYLYCLWKEGRMFQFEKTLSEEEKEQWRSDMVLKTLEYLHEIEKDKTYSEIAQFLKERWQRRVTDWT